MNPFVTHQFHVRSMPDGLTVTDGQKKYVKNENAEFCLSLI